MSDGADSGVSGLIRLKMGRSVDLGKKNKNNGFHGNMIFYVYVYALYTCAHVSI